MTKYLLHGSLIAKPDSLDQLTNILVQASQLMLAKAKGCEMYLVGHSQGNKNAVYITELWTTKEDHEASLSVEGVKELISQAMPLLGENPTKGQEIEIISA